MEINFYQGGQVKLNKKFYKISIQAKSGPSTIYKYNSMVDLNLIPLCDL